MNNLNENDLASVVDDIPYEEAINKALDCYKSIDDLKNLKEEILKGSKELTEEELESTNSGILR